MLQETVERLPSIPQIIDNATCFTFKIIQWIHIVCRTQLSSQNIDVARAALSFDASTNGFHLINTYICLQCLTVPNRNYVNTISATSLNIVTEHMWELWRKREAERAQIRSHIFGYILHSAHTLVFVRIPVSHSTSACSADSIGNSDIGVATNR